MTPNELIADWIDQVNEFELMSQLAKRSYKRVCEGIIDHDERNAYDDEQLGCADAVKILRTLSFPDDTPEDTVKEQTITLLREHGRRHHENEEELSAGIRWSISVIEGNPERHYNAYHPRRDPPPPRSYFRG